MELQALLTSNILPKDIVIHNIYNHLWRNRNLLNKSQIESIVEDHFHMKKIIRMYFRCENLSNDQNSDDYFLIWLENDMIYCLNDNQQLINGISPLLKNECPDITLNLLIGCGSIDKLPEKIYFLWKHMTYEKKMYFYNTCSNL
jgi:hypothetical protein